MLKINEKLALIELYRQGEYLRSEIAVWCPGCDALHSLCIDRHNDVGPCWSWNRNEEAPTFTPSLLVNKLTGNRCHSFIRDGQWQFLSDSYHRLKGQTVEMVDLPAWVFD